MNSIGFELNSCHSQNDLFSVIEENIQIGSLNSITQGGYLNI